MDEPKPTLNALDAMKFKLPEQERKDWRPKAIVEGDRIVRIQSMQTRILKCIKEDALPADECVAALGGCIIWLLGMNMPTLRVCLNTLRDLKDQMKSGMEKQWPTCEVVRADLLRRMIGAPQQIPAETDGADGGSTSPETPQSISGSEPSDGGAKGKIPDSGPDDHKDR